MNKRIVFTLPNGGVGITCPSDNAIRWMAEGGRWAGATRGWLNTQVERFVSAGVSPDIAKRYVDAMMFGGRTTAEALGLIRDRCCAHKGTGIELWDMSDVSSDRWFRNAWRRSPDGGPIWIDLDCARDIQAQKIERATRTWNEAAKAEDTWKALAGRATNGPAIIELDVPRLSRRIRDARSPQELRAVWPDDLPQ